jgi:hypothetical protein
MAEYLSPDGSQNLTSYGGSRYNRNKTAVYLSPSQIALSNEGNTPQILNTPVPLFNPATLTQIELGKNFAGDRLNGHIRNFYYTPLSSTPSPTIISSLSQRKETYPTPLNTPSLTLMVRIPSPNISWSLISSGTVNYDVSWGDGEVETLQTANIKPHTFTSRGIYKVVVTIRSGQWRPFYDSIAPDSGRIIAILGTGAGWQFGNTLNAAFFGCSELVNLEPITLSGVGSFADTWRNCSSLAVFPKNAFNASTATNFTNAFLNCALDTISIENILVSVNTAGQINGTLTLSGGSNAAKSTWTSAANTAYNSLVGKNWTVTFNP